MVIGFIQRSTTVSEGTGFPENVFNISIGVDTLRVSEQEIQTAFILHNNRSTAVVSPFGSTTLQSDAAFGSRDSSGDGLAEYFNLTPDQTRIPPLIASILDDKAVESTECFIIRINFVSIPGEKEPRATCNEEGPSFFCEHIICIEDNDGM